ncbi:MAG: alpha/beta hydrolase [Cyclobacteriaceae bacterium]|nr:alpha/beta hydrolase [Cyclobacteriaceae bacterium]
MKILVRKIIHTLVFLIWITAACSTEEEALVIANQYTTTKTIAYKQISGVDPNLLSLDVYHFENTSIKKPVVVYVHGGAWALGDKANSIDNKRNLFESVNYVFVSVNYRLSPANEELAANRIKFPVHNNDVADAVKWIFDNIGTYGGDANKIVLLGHSAGAHLVSLTGLSQQFLPARGIALTQLKGVASIDTEGYDVEAQVNDNNITYINAFGTNVNDLVAASPVQQIDNTKNYPPFFVAKRGSVTRINIANNFIQALTNAGVQVTTITASQYDHEGINDAIGAPGETAVTEPLLQFFESCFSR